MFENIAIIIAFGIGQPLCRNLIRVDNLKNMIIDLLHAIMESDRWLK